MYFGRGKYDPGLPAAVARAVAAEPFGWSQAPVRMELRVDADLVFTVTDDWAVPCAASGLPLLDRDGRLLDRRRWALAAAAALSTRVSVKVHAGGRHWRQALTRAVPDSVPWDCGPAPGTLTRITFELDAGYFRRGAALPADPALLRPDVPAWVRGSFTVTDRRTAADTRPPGI